MAALELTVGHAVLVTAIDVVMGTAIAWVLVRDSFVGKRVLEVVIDIPFALPTIVAGLVLLSLYGANSPAGPALGEHLARGDAGLPVRHAALRRPHRRSRC